MRKSGISKLAALAFGVAAAASILSVSPASAQANLSTTCYPVATGTGGYSTCVAGTYGVEHRVHVKCSKNSSSQRWVVGPWVGGTSRSYAHCAWYESTVDIYHDEQIQN
jgi:hypothetical protein